MSAPKATTAEKKPAETPVLNAGDTVVLKENLGDGWWKVEINGVSQRLLIGRVKGVKRQRSTEDKEKNLTRTSSKKDASANGLGPAALPLDSIGSIPRTQAQSTPILSPHSSGIPNVTIQASPRPLDRQASPPPPIPEEGEIPVTVGSSTSGNSLGTTDDAVVAHHAQTEGVLLGSLPPAPVSSVTASSSSAGLGVHHADSKRKTVKRDKSDKDRPSSSNTGRGLMRSPSTMRGTRPAVKTSLLDIALDLEGSHADLALIMRVLETQAGVKGDKGGSDEESKILAALSREQVFLEKMLDGSYAPLFNVGVDLKAGVALAPQRLLAPSELLFPSVNLGSLEASEKALLQTLEFNVFPYKDTNNEHHVRLLLMAMFYEFDLPNIFKIPDITLYRFLTVVSRKYRMVPFHNFYHAFNVTQTMYFFLRSCRASLLLGPLEMMAMLIAAMCHDLDHPGLNNDFQRKAQTRVYHMHKKSVLENHHYLQCMSALANTETNILANLSQEDEDQIYIYLRDCILATDLAVHGIILKNLTERKKILGKQFKTGSPAGMIDEDRKLIMVSLIKCADLSNEVRENTMSKVWAKLVMEEFFAQSSLERQLKFPVTPFMDKEKIIMAKEQINFIEKLCLPLYTQLAQVFPEVEKCCLQLEQNRATWQDRLRLFYTHPDDMKKLSNKSIWEREQVKTKGGSSLSATLTQQASNSQLPTKSTRRGTVSQPPPNVVGSATSQAIAGSSTPASSSSSPPPPPPLPSSSMSPSASSPDVRKGEKEKEKGSKEERKKESQRAVSAGGAVQTSKVKK